MNTIFLTQLLNANSPSGYETSATDIFSREMNHAGLDFDFRDEIGNCAYAIGYGRTDFMLSGHIDQIGLQVQYVDDKGFIYFITDGGIDPKTLPGSVVTIITKKGNIKGVIGKTPIHIEWRDESKDKALKVKELKIDIGASNKEEALSLVQIGNPIIVDHPTFFLNDYRLTGGGIDDKIGVFVTAEVMKLLREDERKGKNLNSLRVYGVACTQEEVGGNGATLAARNINPAYSIDYDVTFATDDDCVSPKEWGDVKLGYGGCIAHGPDKDVEMCDDIANVCKKCGVPYQEFSVGAGMTNTNKIRLASSNCKTLLLSIPERNMHTPVEICDMRDVDSLIRMTYHYIKELDRKLDKRC